MKKIEQHPLFQAKTKEEFQAEILKLIKADTKVYPKNLTQEEEKQIERNKVIQNSKK